MIVAAAFALWCCATGDSGTKLTGRRAEPVVVASKPFGESFLLAEMFAQLLEAHGIAVARRPGLGATEVAFAALRTGGIDVYPEYVGTGLVAILHDTARLDRVAAFARVSSEFATRYGVRWLPPLGFENTYAIATTPTTAQRYHLATLTDLARESTHLRAGLTSDFIGRQDGLPGLTREYGMHFRDVRPLAPALKYQALAAGSIDVVDGYSTDGLLSRYHLVTLLDDRHFFPPYDAAALIGPRVARDGQDVAGVLALLSGRLSETRMREWNRRIEVDGDPVATVARDALRATLGTGAAAPQNLGAVQRAGPNLLPLVLRHLLLVGIALGAAILIGVPLGLFAAARPRASDVAIGIFAVVQTIPSIALLAFMIPLLGIGVAPAIAALVLYAIYPIARTTFAGVRGADPDAVVAVEALGASRSQQLRWVRLPLAAPIIMSGVRTAAVITVGAATLAAFIGAGGLGEPIVEGLALADTRLVLSGAIPAAVLALAIDALLALVERLVRPRHLRLAHTGVQ